MSDNCKQTADAVTITLLTEPWCADKLRLAIAPVKPSTESNKIVKLSTDETSLDVIVESLESALPTIRWRGTTAAPILSCAELKHAATAGASTVEYTLPFECLNSLRGVSPQTPLRVRIQVAATGLVLATSECLWTAQLTESCQKIVTRFESGELAPLAFVRHVKDCVGIPDDELCKRLLPALLAAAVLATAEPARSEVHESVAALLVKHARLRVAVKEHCAMSALRALRIEASLQGQSQSVLPTSTTALLCALIHADERFVELDAFIGTELTPPMATLVCSRVAAAMSERFKVDGHARLGERVTDVARRMVERSVAHVVSGADSINDMKSAARVGDTSEQCWNGGGDAWHHGSTRSGVRALLALYGTAINKYDDVTVGDGREAEIDVECGALERALVSALQTVCDDTLKQSAERVERLKARRPAEDDRMSAVCDCVRALCELRAVRGQPAIAEHVHHHIRALTRELHTMLICQCTLAVVGVRGAGKSTLLGALIGVNVLPSNELPCTAVSVVVLHTPGVRVPRLILPKFAQLNALLRTLRDVVNRKAAELASLLQRRHAGGGGGSDEGANSARDVDASGISALNDLCARACTPASAALVRELLAADTAPFESVCVGAAVHDALARLNSLTWLAAQQRVLLRVGDVPAEAPFDNETPLTLLPRVEVEFPCLRGVSLACDVALVDTPGAGELALERVAANSTLRLAQRADVLVEATTVDVVGTASARNLHALVASVCVATGAKLCVLGTKRDLRLALAKDEVIVGEIRRDLQLTKETPVYVVKARHARSAIAGHEWARARRDAFGAATLPPTDEDFRENSWLQYLFEKRYGDEARVKLGELQSLEQFEALCDEMYEKSGVAAAIKEVVTQNALVSVQRRAKALHEMVEQRVTHVQWLLRDEQALLGVSDAKVAAQRVALEQLSARMGSMKSALLAARESVIEQLTSEFARRAVRLVADDGDGDGVTQKQIAAQMQRAAGGNVLVFDSEPEALAAIELRVSELELRLMRLVDAAYVQPVVALVNEKASKLREAASTRVAGVLGAGEWRELLVAQRVFEPPLRDAKRRRSLDFDVGTLLRREQRCSASVLNAWWRLLNVASNGRRERAKYVIDAALLIEQLVAAGAALTRTVIDAFDEAARGYLRATANEHVAAVERALHEKRVCLERVVPSATRTDDTSSAVRAALIRLERWRGDSSPKSVARIKHVH